MYFWRSLQLRKDKRFKRHKNVSVACEKSKPIINTTLPTRLNTGNLYIRDYKLLNFLLKKSIAAQFDG
jgi:hypothetical protein